MGVAERIPGSIISMVVTPIVVAVANHHLLFNTGWLKYEENANHNDSDTDKCQNHKESFGGHSILGTQRFLLLNTKYNLPLE